MKVSVATEDVTVEVEASGGYAPEVMRDLCARACEIARDFAAQGETEEQ